MALPGKAYNSHESSLQQPLWGDDDTDGWGRKTPNNGATIRVWDFFNMCAMSTDARYWPTGAARMLRVYTESWVWEKTPSLCWRTEPTSVSDALPVELSCPLCTLVNHAIFSSSASRHLLDIQRLLSLQRSQLTLCLKRSWGSTVEWTKKAERQTF